MLQDRFRGCLIGGGVGDALGYPVEFMRLSAIKSTYGTDGVQDLILERESGKAQISDDTQMTLFTASGLLWAAHRIRNEEGGDFVPDGIYPSYMRWLYTQDGVERDAEILREQGFEHDGIPKIMNVPELFSCRAPGNTCLSALESGTMGEMPFPINQSKGCGGVMRVAPIGLFLFTTPHRAFMIAAEAAAITHGHRSGQLPAGVLAFMVAEITGGKTLPHAFKDSYEFLITLWGHEETAEKLKAAFFLANSDAEPETAIRELGEGWVAEEALAIALYCVLKEPNPRKALQMAVNHDGDSDSTGAICGNLLGAMHGLGAFPQEWIEKLEILDFILEMADALYSAHKTKGECL